ncbi:MAG: PAS domain S-box protein [Myxococcota bacterium]|jgi:PAS domain S-box-containing protein|nr:PAS domain S-box protein [Myxococcota bacterium]
MPFQTTDAFRMMVEASASGVLVAEIESLRFIYANAAVCDLLGYSADELTQLSLRELHRAADLDWILDVFEAQAGGRRKVAREIPCLRKDGRLIWADITATSAELEGVACNIGFFTDVAERREANRALIESEQRSRESSQLLEAVLNAIPDVIGVQDTCHRVKRYNEAGYRLVQRGEEAHGQKCYEMIGRKRPCPFCPVEMALRSRKVTQLEKHVAEMDKWFDCRAYPVFDSSGEIVCVVEHMRDITQQRALEERLRHTAKMKAVGELAGGLAHDFNNQLGAILGIAEMLRGGCGSQEEQGELVDSLIQTVERASSLTAQLLAFGRRGKFLSVPVDLHDLIEEVSSLLSRSLDKRIRITKRFGAKQACTLGDPSQLQNLLLNLALNARDAMPDGGELIFESSTVELGEERADVRSEELEPGEYVLLCVTDTGIGMDAKTKERIFEPFFTTKDKGKGTGMGLAAVYGTLKNHKGAITVYSEQGHGSTFKVYLPMHCEQPRVRRRSEPELPVSSKNALIMVVDDEPVVLKVASAMLQRLGYDVLACASGVEALERFRTSTVPVAAVLLDMVMPDLGGQAVYELLRAIDPTVRVVLASGYSLNGEAQRILDSGVRAFLQKPFRFAELARVIAEVQED